MKSHKLLLVVPTAGHVVALDDALGPDALVAACQPGDSLAGLCFDRALVLAERDAAFEEWWAEEVVPRFIGQVVLDEALRGACLLPAPNPVPEEVPTPDELAKLWAEGKHSDVYELATRALRARDVAKRLVQRVREEASRECAELAVRLAVAEARLEEADALQERMLGALDKADEAIRANLAEHEKLSRQVTSLVAGSYALTVLRGAS